MAESAWVSYCAGMEVKLSDYSAYSLLCHIVWVCKYRRKVLKPSLYNYTHKLLLGMLRSLPRVELEAIDFD